MIYRVASWIYVAYHLCKRDSRVQGRVGRHYLNCPHCKRVTGPECGFDALDHGHPWKCAYCGAKPSFYWTAPERKSSPYRA
jgi:transcription elongation factor Elf1